MPRFKTQRQLPYSARQLSDMVADVARYPDFLPWCKAARVYNKKGDIFDADLIIGFNLFREQFTSRVEVVPGSSVKVDYLDGPLRRLYNYWIFKEDPKGLTNIDFEVDFEFKSRMLEKLIGEVFSRATQKMVSAFEARARDLYGDPKTVT